MQQNVCYGLVQNHKLEEIERAALSEVAFIIGNGALPNAVFRSFKLKSSISVGGGVNVVSRPRSDNRKKALQLWLKSGRQMKLVDIARELGVSDVLIRKWKYLDKWDEIPAKRPRGAPRGNKNAVGNRGGGAPKGNQNALKHGLCRKLLPDEMQDLMKEVENLDPLDMLWHGVELAYAKMLWAQRIMFVQGKNDTTRELKRVKEGGKLSEREWELQFAWDKEAAQLKAFALINRELRSAIRQFLAMAPEDDERRAKIELMRAQVEKVKAETEEINRKNAANDLDEASDDGFIEALRGKASEVWGADGEPNDEEA